MKSGRSIFLCIFFIGLMVACLSSCSTATTESTKVSLKPLDQFTPAERYIIAVIPFEYKGKQEQYKILSNKLDDLIIGEILQTGRFRVVERSRIDVILKEMALSQAGIIDENTAGKIGKQLGAEMVLVGSLTAVNPIRKRDSIGSSVWRETRGFEISLQGRLTDIVRGEIVAASKATGMEAQQEKMAFGAKTGLIAPEETLLNKAMETAVRILVNNLAGQIMPRSGS